MQASLPQLVGRGMLLFLLTQLGACTFASGRSEILVTSVPAGAEILVDGENTGSHTPSLIELDGFLGDDHDITIQKDGYDPETRRVVHYTSTYTSRWIDGGDELVQWVHPLFWTMGDFLTPFGVEWQYVPHEVHVRLYPPGEGPVTPQGIGN